MNQLQAYQEASVTTADKGQLIVMLYEGAIKFLKLAQKQIETGNHEARNRYMIRAQDIITELNSVLDTEAGGQIAKNFRQLYDFMYRQLLEANIRQDSAKIDEVINLLEELNAAWKAIAE